MISIKSISVAILLCMLIVGCGGGGSDSETEQPSPVPPTQSTNNPPIIRVATNVTVEEGSYFEIDASQSTDPDGSVTQYQWRQLSGMTLNLQAVDTAVVNFTSPEVNSDQVIVLELTVTDDDNTTTSTQVTVTVEDTTLMQPVVSLQRSGSTVEVMWNDANAASYRVLYWQEGNRPNERITSDNNLDLSNLPSGTYNILVEAYDLLGHSIFSAPSQIGV